MPDFYQLSEQQQAQAMVTLATAALPLWGLAGSQLALIKYRENAVFRVDTPNGNRFALRIHRYGYHSDAALRSDLSDYAAAPGNADNYSMIHADFVAENLMVDGDSVRLIDFDDAGFGWHALI